MTPDVAVVIPLNHPLGPADDTVTAPLCSTSTSTSRHPPPGTPHSAVHILACSSLRALARALLQYHVLERDLATKRLIELALVLDILHPKRCT
jgi:hypothetical protein